MRTSTTFSVVLCALPFAVSACGPTDGSSRPGAADAAAVQAPDTARLRAIYAQIDGTYDSLQTRYAAMASGLSADQRQVFQSMHQMYGQSAAMHRLMLSDTAMARGGMMGRGAMMGRGGTTGSGMYDGMRMGGVREWDEQMLGMHQAMSTMHRQAGEQDLAAMNDRMARLYEQALQDTPSDTAAPPERDGEEASGSDAFTQNCAACHGAEGRGVAGAFPPLAMSDWVTGEARTPVRIVLYGLQGSMQVGGAAFNGTMPAFGARLTDQELAAVLSYVRSSWGNDAPAISPGDVKTVREAETGRTRPFTPGDIR